MSLAQKTFCTHWQMPPQSAPPLAGSHESFGSSTHFPAPGQGLPAKPPQLTVGTSATHWAMGLQGAFTHSTFFASQCVPAAQRTVAQGSTASGGGGLHLQVAQPLPSSTLPYSQKIVQTGGQVGAGAFTQSQTCGDESNTSPVAHEEPALHWQMPPQSAPPAFGSHESPGSSTQLAWPGQANPAIPPQRNDGISTHTAMPGQGALMH
ncbi:MAG: hypothetical protein ABIW57_12835 [Polyangia bacterium]